MQPADDLIKVEEHCVRAGVGGVAIVVIADIGRARAVLVIDE